MLTIMGGAWSGRRLKALEKEGLRPSSARVKASIFSILESLQWKRSGSPDFSGWRCLDLFAGVGGLGLEVLSRGAEHCVFVEKERSHGAILKENIRTLGCESKAAVLIEPVEKGGWMKHGPFDLVLVDPPYANSHLPELLEKLCNGYLAPGAIILFEHDPKVHFGPQPPLEIHSERKLGPAGITVFLFPAS